jgi:sec-independent protein translocase protein TatB
MFDVGASELLLIVVVAVVVIGPKDLPLALRTAGRWIGKMRRMSAYFRSGIETMIREAEMEDMEKKWREQNEAIMKAHPDIAAQDPVQAHDLPGLPPAASAEAALAAPSAPTAPTPEPAPEAEPQLPLGRS